MLANSFLLIISGLWLMLLERSEKAHLSATLYQHFSEIKLVLGLLLTPLGLKLRPQAAAALMNSERA